MENFEFINPTRILFGRGEESKAGEQAARYSKKILLHYGSNFVKTSGLLDKITKSLNASGVEYIELGGVKPNPRLSLVYEGIELCRKHDLGLILAVGGGSTIDSAKAIAMGAVFDGDVWDFFLNKAVPEKALPVGTVLTIPAAGSEASTGTVITNEEGDFKRAVNSELIYPRFSILNPEIACSLPDFQVACGATDILAHLMERYFTNTKNVAFVDRLLEATMKNIILMGPKVMADKEDYDAWGEFMWSGTIAHNNLLNTGRTGDWASHDIEHEISGIYDVAHGAGLAVVFPAWMKYTLHNDINRFVQWAVRVWNVDLDVYNPEATALEGIRRMEEFFHSLGLGTTLKDINVPDDRLQEMAAKCTDNDAHTVGNFVTLDTQAVYDILQLTK